MLDPHNFRNWSHVILLEYDIDVFYDVMYIPKYLLLAIIQSREDSESYVYL